MRVPPGAVDRSVRVRVTVPDRQILFARFEPHGLQFSKPATVRFDLTGSNAERGGPLKGAYVGEGSETKNGRFAELETLPAVVSGDHAKIEVLHFSGYIVASGRSGY